MLCFLIDDDTDDQDVFIWALAEIDPTIQHAIASAGAAAVELLRSDTTFVPDYIFLDLNMPLMNGKQCLVELRKMPWLESTPIIIYSTSSDPRDIEETKQLGAADYIVKPSRFAALVDTLAETLQKHDQCSMDK